MRSSRHRQQCLLDNSQCRSLKCALALGSSINQITKCCVEAPGLEITSSAHVTSWQQSQVLGVKCSCIRQLGSFSVCRLAAQAAWYAVLLPIPGAFMKPADWRQGVRLLSNAETASANTQHTQALPKSMQLPLAIAVNGDCVSTKMASRAQ